MLLVLETTLIEFILRFRRFYTSYDEDVDLKKSTPRGRVTCSLENTSNYTDFVLRLRKYLSLSGINYK